MKISVLIPLYNGAETIQRCLENLFSYDSRLLEIIIVDDGSTDDSLKKCSEIIENRENVILLKNENKGVSSARNLGIKLATGDLIAFCDSDDFFEKNIFNYIVGLFEQNANLDIVCAGYNRVKSTGEIIKSLCLDSCKIIEGNDFIPLVLTDECIMGSVWNKIFKASLVKEIEFDETLSYCEDKHFMVKLLTRNRNANVYLLDKPIYNYVINESSVTNNPTKLFDEENKLKYCDAINNIIRLLHNDIQNIDRAKYCKVVICMDTVRNFSLTKSQHKFVKKEIISNIAPYMHYLEDIGLKNKIKKFIYIALIILNIK